MTALRTAVIGVGYLGRFHAHKYAALADSQLVGVVDLNAAARQQVGDELKVPYFSDYRELLGKVDAVSIATPTPYHFEVASAFLESGAHVLVEKPITTTVQDAQRLIELAARKRRVLQVGHLERFNAVILALDLMIHDIDIIQTIVRSPLATIDAVGASVFSRELDIVNARLRFENGCVANTTASRVSLKTERKLRLFQDDAYMSIDLQQKILTVVRKEEEQPDGELPQVRIDERNFEQGDALKAEIESFLACIRSGDSPVVTGEDGLRALQTAIRITEQIVGAQVQAV